MLRIEIETVWRFHKEGSPQTAVVMLGILNEIRKTGKLTSAAEHAQLSYRHVWNLVEQWSDFFGGALVETHRGKGTKLTAFGEKLVWAAERVQARLGPQLENLAQELATEIKPFLHQRPSVIRVHASHGFAVSKLRELLDREPGIGVDCATSAIKIPWCRWRRAPATSRGCICRTANCARKVFRRARSGSIRARTA
jgi:molybdate transport repressor ModE-like protein